MTRGSEPVPLRGDAAKLVNSLGPRLDPRAVGAVARQLDQMIRSGLSPHALESGLTHGARGLITVGFDENLGRMAVRPIVSERAVTRPELPAPGIDGTAIIKRCSQVQVAGNGLYFPRDNPRDSRRIDPDRLTRAVNRANSVKDRLNIALGSPELTRAMLLGIDHKGSWQSLADSPGINTAAISDLAGKHGLNPIPVVAEPVLSLKRGSDSAVAELSVTSQLFTAHSGGVLLRTCADNLPYVATRDFSVCRTDYYGVGLDVLQSYVGCSSVDELFTDGDVGNDARLVLDMALAQPDGSGVINNPIATVYSANQSIGPPQRLSR